MTLDTHRITQNFDEFSNLGSQDHLHRGTPLANRYLIQDILGIGGMGAVYLARDLHFPNVIKRVAVKEMVNQVRDPSLRETIVRNFEREANILATLDHPSIPRIYDYFTQDDRSYLILEFIDGKDLEAMLNEAQGFFPEVQVMQWAIELCDVLSYLHNHKPEPIVFRDMKPSNVMINSFGHVMLIDFGIAKPFQSGQKGTMIGTEGYSPPEQYKGEAGPLADIYSLGATLHHLLTRHDPRLEAPFSFSERPIRQINPLVSFEMETVIATALQYNPEDRFPTTEVMKESLLNCARKTGLLSKVAASTSHSVQASEELSKLLWRFECEDEIRGSPTYYDDILYVGSYDNNLYALQADKGEFIWKYATDGGIVSKPIVVDGNVIVGSEDQRLHVISCRSGKVVWTYYSKAPIRSSPVIAEGHIFIGSDDGYLHAVNVISGRLAWRFDTGFPVRSTPLIANDYVYFGAESGDFFAVDFSGALKWRFKAKRAITGSAVYSQGTIFFGSMDTTLYALDAKSGYIIWRYRMAKASISTPCLADNLVITGSADNNIYCVDATSAKEIWRYTTQHQVNGSPIIYRDSLYCGSVDGKLYCIDYRTGRLRWFYETEGPITSTPTVNENILFFGSVDHYVYALSI